MRIVIVCILSWVDGLSLESAAMFSGFVAFRAEHWPRFTGEEAGGEAQRKAAASPLCLEEARARAQSSIAE